MRAARLASDLYRRKQSCTFPMPANARIDALEECACAIVSLKGLIRQAVPKCDSWSANVSRDSGQPAGRRVGDVPNVLNPPLRS
jgi:hypothetical protein